VLTQSAVLARQAAMAKLAEVKADPQAKLSNTTVLARGSLAEGFPESVIAFVLGADPRALPAARVIDIGEAGAVVVRVTQVLPWQPSAGEAPRVRQSYAAVWARAELAAYEAALKKRYKAEIKPAAAEATASAPSR